MTRREWLELALVIALGLGILALLFLIGSEGASCVEIDGWHC